MRSRHDRTTAARTWPAFIAIFVLGGLALSAWSLSGPAGSTPDEEFHMASIWCGQGVDGKHCEPGSSDGSRQVPKDLDKKTPCYATESTKSADCLGTGFGDDSTPSGETTRGTSSGGTTRPSTTP
ncbi:hypothetical protein [Aeromicrobium wangtongii]|uniref:hypothetical protein n=1 Tax=Aeromicrobium wangtongii TaxID=2969247 RepID=UPI003555EC90